MHKEETINAEHGHRGMFRRLVLAMLMGWPPLVFADDTVTGRATVRDHQETVAEPKRAFESVLLAQAKLPPVDSLPEPPPPIIIQEPNTVVLPNSDLPPAAPLYLDSPESQPRGLFRNSDWKREILPDSLLWQPPIANPLQPRLSIKGTNLTRYYTTETLDTAIGATMPMVRWTAPDPRDLAWQMDFFALALSRWTERDRPVGQDYRFGVLFTGATGNWSWKFGYEHTSCHVGDELIKQLGPSINRDSHIREELVLGLAYTFWEQLRVYTVGAYAFSQTLPTDENLDQVRFNWGLEWVSPRRYLRVIQPYGAADVEYRGDQRYIANVTLQAGIRIQASSHRAAIRFGLEYYRGNSPYGQFFDNREEWTGIFASFDY